MSFDMRNVRVAVIMAGGAGTRFWPLSTEAHPKQFLRLLGERSLLQQSYDRLVSGQLSQFTPEHILVLTNAQFVSLVKEQLPELPADNIIGEPMRKDTAAAVALAVALVKQRFGEMCTMAVLTADHVIEPAATFQAALHSAMTAAEKNRGALYTFGVTPTYAATGYGYLQRGAAVEQDANCTHYQLKTFKEKPDAKTAEQYIASGDFYWNSGMFVWHMQAICDELTRHIPQHLALLTEAVRTDKTPEFEGALRQSFSALSAISIDYAVMEKAAQVHCVVADFSWNDVGGWLALRDFLPQDETTHTVARGHTSSHAAQNNIVFCEDDSEHVALVGVDDLIVVRTGKKTLVMHQKHAEALKQLVQKLPPTLK